MPAYERRDLSQGAPDPDILLAGDITAGSISINISGATGWPTGSAGPFFIVINRNGASEEKILCSSRSTNTLTVAGGAAGRGLDGTSAGSHTTGETVEITYTARDFDEANYTTAETVGKVTAAGQILVSDAANSFAGLDVNDSGKILIGNGTTLQSLAMSGDATLDAAGELTLVANAVFDLIEPIGSCKISFAASYDTARYLPADGAAVSRATYAALYSALGGAASPWGQGNGSTTFNTPKVAGRAMMGAGAGSGLTSRAAGDLVGAEEITLTAAESGLPAHNHTQDAHTHTQTAHTHVQDAHTHIQNVHVHAESTAPANALAQAGSNQAINDGGETGLTDGATAVNQNTTATNQNTTAVNQNATATNQANSAAAASEAHDNIQPSIAVPVLVRYA